MMVPAGKAAAVGVSGAVGGGGSGMRLPWWFGGVGGSVVLERWQWWPTKRVMLPWWFGGRWRQLAKGGAGYGGWASARVKTEGQRDGNSQIYLTFRQMFKNFNREDLKVLWSIVKSRFEKTKTVDYMDTLLLRNLKTMFEHHIEDTIWTYQQGSAKVKNWKLYDSCGVYCITMQNIVHYLLVEKMYPLTRNTLHRLWNDVRIHVDYKVEMAYDLLRLIRKQLREGYSYCCSDKTEGSSKRATQELDYDKSKKQKLDENVEVAVNDDDSAELKRWLEIVPEDEDDMTVDATPLSSNL
nr:hypothetical protein [Tanacetum cinerariifolium]